MSPDRHGCTTNLISGYSPHQTLEGGRELGRLREATSALKLSSARAPTESEIDIEGLANFDHLNPDLRSEAGLGERLVNGLNYPRGRLTQPWVRRTALTCVHEDEDSGGDIVEAKTNKQVSLPRGLGDLVELVGHPRTERRSRDLHPFELNCRGVMGAAYWECKQVYVPLRAQRGLDHLVKRNVEEGPVGVEAWQYPTTTHRILMQQLQEAAFGDLRD